MEDTDQDRYHSRNTEYVVLSFYAYVWTNIKYSKCILYEEQMTLSLYASHLKKIFDKFMENKKKNWNHIYCVVL